MNHIIKRDGRIVPFDEVKITTAVWKAMRAVGTPDEVVAKRLSDLIVGLIDERFVDEYPTVEEIQDLVEETLIEAGYIRTAKAYILYRKQHADLREIRGLLTEIPLVEDYLFDRDWRVRENSNMSYSLQGLNTHITDRVITRYWLNKIYPGEIRETQRPGDPRRLLCRLGYERPSPTRLSWGEGEGRIAPGKTLPCGSIAGGKLHVHPAG
jgi:ribonucleoside-triphosphate reductase